MARRVKPVLTKQTPWTAEERAFVAEWAGLLQTDIIALKLNRTAAGVLNVARILKRSRSSAVERPTFNGDVDGSNPSGITNSTASKAREAGGD